MLVEFFSCANKRKPGHLDIREGTMMQITQKIICRFGASALLPVCVLWASMPAYADPGAPADLTSVRELAEKGSVRDEITLAADYFSGTGVAQDSKMAAYWYEKAAGHGNP